VLTFGDKRVYVAGDTEGTPEMKALKDIAIAFLPCNLPYTMTPEEAAQAARAFKPKVLYPYHQGTRWSPRHSTTTRRPVGPSRPSAPGGSRSGTPGRASGRCICTFSRSPTRATALATTVKTDGQYR